MSDATTPVPAFLDPRVLELTERIRNQLNPLVEEIDAQDQGNNPKRQRGEHGRVRAYANRWRRRALAAERDHAA